MSAESGLPTFRGMGGVWENYRVEDVASPEAWARDPELVLRFYNERRKKLLEAAPNEGHRIVAQWEKDFHVTIVTQNVDDLHERAGSTRVIHLHGELRKARSTADPSLVLPIEGWELARGQRCPLGSQLRPHIVWFGEEVTELPKAQKAVAAADIFVVVGTSLLVYPAASLVHEARPSALKFLVDPAPPRVPGFEIFSCGASQGLREVDRKLPRPRSPERQNLTSRE